MASGPGELMSPSIHSHFVSNTMAQSKFGDGRVYNLIKHLHLRGHSETMNPHVRGHRKTMNAFWYVPDIVFNF